MIKLARFTRNSGVCACVCVCVCMCVCVCVFTCVTSIREGFICLNHLGYQGTDRRCYAEDVSFQVPSSLLQNAEPNFSNQSLYLVRTLEAAKPRLNQCTSRFLTWGLYSPLSRHPLWCALHRKPICFCVSTHERGRNLTRKGEGN